MDIAVYNANKEPLKTITLDDGVFGARVRPGLIQEAVRVLQGNLRKPIAHAKGRGEVSGGGKKPWRQKGTGRARHGSIRSPLWRKGGVTHGPLSERTFNLSLNKKMKQRVLSMVLSSKAKRGLLYVVSDDAVAEFSKTKQAQAFADAFLKEGRKYRQGFLLHAYPNAAIARGVRNLPYLHWAPPQGINILDCINAFYLIFSESSVKAVTASMKKQS